ncbi:MAG: decaprenyl-phosphate phosphoribosyltransferase [Chitinophagaceae bacterium]|nr:decaprenyl-phosphate phosphoribosyltransferase [Chitinophagaceae bacterium]
MAYISLLRPKDWAKNLFLLIPLFFAGELFDWEKTLNVCLGILSFCCIASSIYVINDYADIEEDKKHPVKCSRPLASGKVSPAVALIIFGLLFLIGLTSSYFLNRTFFFLLGIYFFLNLGYSFGLKSIPILDIFIIAIGFSLRVRSGGVLAGVGITIWLNIMIFLLALFMAIGKRRDDVLLTLASGTHMRKAVKGYTLDFLNSLLALVSAVMIVAYLMYTLSENVIARHGTQRLYYTSLFVIAGIMRYLQIIYVKVDSGSPTKILYKDRFIQVSIFLWMISFYFLLYIKKTNF